jgi:hypothetical protein
LIHNEHFDIKNLKSDLSYKIFFNGNRVV